MAEAKNNKNTIIAVVAVVIVVAKASALADATIGPAVAPFTAAVGLTVYCARQVRRNLGRQDRNQN